MQYYIFIAFLASTLLAIPIPKQIAKIRGIKQLNDMTSGMDLRYPTPFVEPHDMAKFCERLEKIRLLRTLENPVISDIEKIRRIHEEIEYEKISKYAINLSAGGLDNPFGFIYK